MNEKPLILLTTKTAADVLILSRTLADLPTEPDALRPEVIAMLGDVNAEFTLSSARDAFVRSLRRALEILAP